MKLAYPYPSSLRNRFGGVGQVAGLIKEKKNILLCGLTTSYRQDSIFGLSGKGVRIYRQLVIVSIRQLFFEV